VAPSLRTCHGDGASGCKPHDIQYSTPCFVDSSSSKEYLHSHSSNLPIGGAVLVGLAIFLRVPGRSSTFRSLPLKAKIDNMDPLGSILIMGAACCLLLAMQWGGDAKPWNSPDVIGCLVGAAIIGTLFLHWQWRRQERALIIPRVFKQRSIWTGSISVFFLGAQAYAVRRLHFISAQFC
jgi:hypothetical protein